MRFLYFDILRMLLDSSIRRTPLKVMRELEARGIKRAHPGVKSVSDAWNGLRFLHKWLDSEMPSKHNGKWVLNSFFPPFPSDSFDRMFENSLSGRRLSPVSAYVAVTSTCPLSCKHCSVAGRRMGNLSRDTLVDLMRQFRELGVSICGLTGGEPTTRYDLADIVRAAAKEGMSPVLFTSGYGLGEAQIAELAKAGLWAIAISIDSDIPEEHDEFRGRKGAFEAAFRAAFFAARYGLYTMISTVASKESVKSEKYRKIYKIASDLGIHEYRIIEPMPCGRLDSDSDMLLSGDDIRKIRDFHYEINRKGKLPKVCAFNVIESPEFFGCGGGTQHLFVDSAGEVCPCDFTPLSFGNIRNESLAAIWSRMNDAMHNPRRHCFIQKHAELIHKKAEGKSFPLQVSDSLEICREAGAEDFPDYFQFTTGRRH